MKNISVNVHKAHGEMASWALKSKRVSLCIISRYTSICPSYFTKVRGIIFEKIIGK